MYCELLDMCLLWNISCYVACELLDLGLKCLIYVVSDGYASLMMPLLVMYCCLLECASFSSWVFWFIVCRSSMQGWCWFIIWIKISRLVWHKGVMKVHGQKPEETWFTCTWSMFGRWSQGRKWKNEETK